MNYGKNKKTPEERYKSLRKVSLLNIALNSALAAAKIAIGVFSGSNAVISDGINNFSDALTTVAVIVGLKLSSGEADRDHQYGHGRFESLVSVFLSLLLAATALLLGYSGVQKLLDGERVEPSVASIIVMAISIATKEVMYRYTYKKGRELKSTAVIADAWNYRSDSISSAAVLIGVAGGFFGAWFLEHIAALTVCVAILFAAAGIMREAVAGLTDRATSEFEKRRIEDIILAVPGISHIDLIRTRVSNNVIFVELEISVPRVLTIVEAHNIAKKIHDDLEETEDLDIEHCMVHVNPEGDDAK